MTNKETNHRVIRGGSWAFDPQSADDTPENPGEAAGQSSYEDLGVRLVEVIEDTK